MGDISEYLKIGTDTSRSEHEEAILEVLELMDDDRYKYWCGRLKRFKPQEIKDLVKQARTGHSPQKLFNYLIKK